MPSKKLTINDREYTVDILNPLDAIKWINRLRYSGLMSEGGAAADSEEVSKMMLEAVKRCWTPENNKLSDEVEFRCWFTAHPEDLYQLGYAAVMEVCRDFLKLPGNTGK